MPAHRLAQYFLVLLIILVAMATPVRATGNADQAKPIVAVFKINSDVTETPGEGFSLFGKQPVSLRDLTSRLNKAAADANVKAVVLLMEGGSLGSAQIEEVRQSIEKLKQAGKPVWAHSDSLGMKEYSLLSSADRLSVVPIADLWIVGFHGEAPYLRGLLDKLGVRPDYLHCGDYKSAGEIFMLDGPSPEADRMQNWLLDSLYATHVDLIAKGRKVDVDKVRAWIDNGPYTAEQGKSAGLVDAIEHRQDFEANLKSKFGESVTFEKNYGEPKEPELDLSSPFGLLKIWGEIIRGGSKKEVNTKPTVGIVYVDGAIDLGAGDDSPFTSGGAHSTAIRKALDDAASDDNIKAVVLRVDSPGGSAVASEIILDATKRVKAKKPFVVSMGNVAGSGGYYVACASDVIYADRSTITASIGVVGGKFVTTDMWKKVGITFKEYNRGKNAGLLASSRTFNDDERARMQGWMNDIYGVFKSHVTQSRGSRLKKPIDELAGGRVFTGQQALDLGLVDQLGTLQDAIDYVASNAKLGDDYDVRAVPAPKNFLEKLMESSSKKEDINHVRAALFGAPATGSIVDLAMPLLQNLDPHRVQQIRAALRSIDMMQKDGVILTTPELMMMSR
ncbi:signal peptide peptidase SppA [soil metagenome]